MTNTEESAIENIKSKILLKSIIYPLVMFLGSMIYFHYSLNVGGKITYGIAHLIIPALIFILICLVISVVIGQIKKFTYGRKDKTQKRDEPLWFSILESCFATWFVLVIIISVGNFVV